MLSFETQFLANPAIKACIKPSLAKILAGEYIPIFYLFMSTKHFISFKIM